MSNIPPSPVLLITGGSSGIGLGLAKAFYQRGAKVIIGSRRESTLADICAAHPGMESCVVDVADGTAIKRCAEEMERRFPDLNMLINNAGIQRQLDFDTETPPGPEAIAPEIDTNLRGLIHMTAAFIPLLRRQPAATIIQMSSGLAYIPLASTPVYSATKAAVHSFSTSLRHQLRDTNVRVVEILPPAVKTDLIRDQTRQPSPVSMELNVFIRKTMRALDSGKTELPIGLARRLATGYRLFPGAFFKIINSYG